MVKKLCRFAFASCMAFSCCLEVMTPNNQKSGLKMPSVSRSTSKSRQPKADEIIANELVNIEEMFSSIKSATDANTAEIAEIKSLSKKTEANVKKATEQNAVLNIPIVSPAMKGDDYCNTG